MEGLTRGEYDNYDYRRFEEMTLEECIASCEKALNSVIEIQKTHKEDFWKQKEEEIRAKLKGFQEAQNHS